MCELPQKLEEKENSYSYIEIINKIKREQYV